MMGFQSFLVDSFTGRALTSVTNDQDDFQMIKTDPNFPLFCTVSVGVDRIPRWQWTKFLCFRFEL